MMTRSRGQVMLEFAVSMVGMVALICVVIKTWMWFDTMLVQRQHAFQQSRLAAGQQATAGVPVAYQRPPLSLAGPLTDHGGGPTDWVPTPPCTAAQPFFDQANTLRQQGQALVQEADQLTQTASQLGVDFQRSSDACAAVRDSRARARCFANLQPLMQQLQQTMEDAQARRQQAQALLEQVQGLIQQGNAACR